VGGIWEKRRIPEDWKVSIICPIHKIQQFVGGIWEKRRIPEDWKVSIICPIHNIQQLVGIIWEKRRIPEDWKVSIICPIHNIQQLVGIIWEKRRIPEVWKVSIICPIHNIQQLVGIIWEKRRIPEDWKVSITFPIHKKVDKFKEPELRGMLLLCTADKTFTTILRNKVETYKEKVGGAAVAQWLRRCATNRNVAGWIPGGVIGIFYRHNPSDRTMSLGSIQPLRKMSTRSIFWG